MFTLSSLKAHFQPPEKRTFNTHVRFYVGYNCAFRELNVRFLNKKAHIKLTKSAHLTHLKAHILHT